MLQQAMEKLVTGNLLGYEQTCTAGHMPSEMTTKHHNLAPPAASDSP